MTGFLALDYEIVFRARARAGAGVGASVLIAIQQRGLLVSATGVAAAAGVVSATGVAAAAGVIAAHDRVGRDGSVILHEGDFVGQEVVDALAVDNLKRGREAWHEALNELGCGFLLGLCRTSGDETDGEVAEAEELD